MQSWAGVAAAWHRMGIRGCASACLHHSCCRVHIVAWQVVLKCLSYAFVWEVQLPWNLHVPMLILRA